MGTAGTSSGWRSCSSLPCQTSCGSSDGSRGYRMVLGAFSWSWTKSRNSSVGMLARLSLCLVARTGVGDLGLGCLGFMVFQSVAPRTALFVQMLAILLPCNYRKAPEVVKFVLAGKVVSHSNRFENAIKCKLVIVIKQVLKSMETCGGALVTIPKNSS